MQIVFSPKAKDEFNEWLKSGNRLVVAKIGQLISAIAKNPFTGIGKPESLKHELQGYWSRRINREHRLIYRVDDNTIFIYSVKGHYL